MRIDAHPLRIGRCIRMANPMNYYLYADEILVLYLLYLHPSLGVQQLCIFMYIF